MNDASNTAAQYGPSYFNRPQRFVVNYSWDLPFGKHTGAVNKLLGGWNLSGVTVIQSGNRFTVIDSANGTIYGTSSTTLAGGYASAYMCPGTTYNSMYSSGGIESRLGGPSGGPGWFASNAFCTAPAIGDGTGWGNIGAGAAKGPGQFNFDTTFQKITKITERQSIQFRAEFLTCLTTRSSTPPTRRCLSARCRT